MTTADLAARWLPAMLDASLKALAILAAACLAVALMRRASAAARQFVWFSTVTAALLLPLFSAALPNWRILPAWAQVPFNPPAAAPSATPPPALPAVPAVPAQAPPRSPAKPAPAAPAAPLPPSYDLAATLPPAPAPAAVEPSPIAPTLPAAPTPPALQPVSTPNPPAPTPPSVLERALPWCLAAWAAGVLACLAPVVLGWISLWRLRRSCRPITEPAWLDLLARAAATMGLKRRVRLLESDRRAIPMIWGLFRPTLLVPAEAARWSAGRRWVVLLHELGHAKRWDCLTRLLARVACAVYWFNPLAWVAMLGLQNEAERACDDLVLSAGNRPSDYAEHVLHIASGLQSPPPSIHGAIAMAHPSRLEGRLLAILDPRRNRRALTRLGLLLASAALLALAIPLAILHAADKVTPSLPNTPATRQAPLATHPATPPGRGMTLAEAIVESAGVVVAQGGEEGKTFTVVENLDGGPYPPRPTVAFFYSSLAPGEKPVPPGQRAILILGCRASVGEDVLKVLPDTPASRQAVREAIAAATPTADEATVTLTFVAGGATVRPLAADSIALTREVRSTRNSFWASERSTPLQPVVQDGQVRVNVRRPPTNSPTTQVALVLGARRGFPYEGRIALAPLTFRYKDSLSLQMPVTRVYSSEPIGRVLVQLVSAVTRKPVPGFALAAGGGQNTNYTTGDDGFASVAVTEREAELGMWVAPSSLTDGGCERLAPVKVPAQRVMQAMKTGEAVEVVTQVPRIVGRLTFPGAPAGNDGLTGWVMQRHWLASKHEYSGNRGLQNRLFYVFGDECSQMKPGQRGQFVRLSGDAANYYALVGEVEYILPEKGAVTIDVPVRLKQPLPTRPAVTVLPGSGREIAAAMGPAVSLVALCQAGYHTGLRTTWQGQIRHPQAFTPVEVLWSEKPAPATILAEYSIPELQGLPGSGPPERFIAPGERVLCLFQPAPASDSQPRFTLVQALPDTPANRQAVQAAPASKPGAAATQPGGGLGSAGAEMYKEDLSGCGLPHGELVLPGGGGGQARPLVRFSDGTMNPDPVKPDEKLPPLERLARRRAARLDLQYSSVERGTFVVSSERVADLGAHFLHELAGTSFARPQPVVSQWERSGKGETYPGFLEHLQEGHCYLVETAEGKYALVRFIQKQPRAALVQYVYQPNGKAEFEVPRCQRQKVPPLPAPSVPVSPAAWPPPGPAVPDEKLIVDGVRYCVNAVPETQWFYDDQPILIRPSLEAYSGKPPRRAAVPPGTYRFTYTISPTTGEALTGSEAVSFPQGMGGSWVGRVDIATLIPALRKPAPGDYTLSSSLTLPGGAVVPGPYVQGFHVRRRELALTLSADKARYASGETITLVATLRNLTDAPIRIDKTRPIQLVLESRNGSDSLTCPTGAIPAVLPPAASGRTVELFKLTFVAGVPDRRFQMGVREELFPVPFGCTGQYDLQIRFTAFRPGTAGLKTDSPDHLEAIPANAAIALSTAAAPAIPPSATRPAGPPPGADGGELIEGLFGGRTWEGTIPANSPGQAAVTRPEPIRVGVAPDGRASVGGKTLSDEALGEFLRQAVKPDAKRPVYIHAAHGARWGRVVEVFNLAVKAGFTEVGFVPARPAPASAPGAAAGVVLSAKERAEAVAVIRDAGAEERCRREAVIALLRSPYTPENAEVLAEVAAGRQYTAGMRWDACEGLRGFSHKMTEAVREPLRRKLREAVVAEGAALPNGPPRVLNLWGDADWIAETMGERLRGRPEEVEVLASIRSREKATARLWELYQARPAAGTLEDVMRRRVIGTTLLDRGDTRGVDVLLECLTIPESLPDNGPVSKGFRDQVEAAYHRLVGAIGHEALTTRGAEGRLPMAEDVAEMRAWWQEHRATFRLPAACTPAADAPDRPRPDLWQAYPALAARWKADTAAMEAYLAKENGEAFARKYPGLAKAVDSADPNERRRVYAAIGQLRDPTALPLLVRSARAGAGPTQMEALQALTEWVYAAYNAKDISEPLRLTLPLYFDRLVAAGDAPDERAHCFQAIGCLAGAEWLPLLKELAASRHPAVTHWSGWAIEQVQRRVLR